MSTEKKETTNIFMTTFDILFIMLLCFATLLSTMLMRGKVIVGSGSTAGLEYIFNAKTFLITIGSFVFYLFFLIKKSDKELRQMVGKVYGSKEGVQK
jgi:hypothetical protein